MMRFNFEGWLAVARRRIARFGLRRELVQGHLTVGYGFDSYISHRFRFSTIDRHARFAWTGI